MQISANSAAYGSAHAQKLLSMILRPQAEADGQEMPGEVQAGGKGRLSGPPPGPPPSGGTFASMTLSSLLGAQEESGEADMVSDLIASADADSDGALSLDEIRSALGQDGDALSEAVAKLDSDGDGRLGAAELSAALGSFGRTHSWSRASAGATAQAAA